MWDATVPARTPEPYCDLDSMQATAVTADTLRRLSRLGAGGHPVLSVYFDLDPSRFPTPAARDTELSALLTHAGADHADTERVRELMRRRPELVRGARAAAIFSCAASGALEAVPLPEPVEPMCVVDTVPWLEPLAAELTSEDWAVAVVSRRAARLFRGGPHGLVEFATVQDALHRRHAQGGWSQARFQRGIEHQVAEHVRHTAERLLRAHRRRAFDHVVVVAADELWPTMEASLHADLRSRLAGQVALDLEQAPVEEIAHAIAPVIERAGRERERELLASLEESLGNGGAAAAGLDEVLATLQERRVDVLLLSETASLTAGLCPRCGQLFAAGESCPADGVPLDRANAVAHMIDLAAEQAVNVVVVRHELAALCKHGEVAALLRW